jgi:predicted protein tyrosine phosphatase
VTDHSHLNDVLRSRIRELEAKVERYAKGEDCKATTCWYRLYPNIDPQTIAWREAKERLVADCCTQADYDGLKVEVKSLREMGEYEPEADEVCISIYSYEHEDWPGTSRPTTISPAFDDILYLQFDDVPDMKRNDPRFIGATEITEAQAEDIARFVMQHRTKRKLLIHCYMGASRSRSTAAAIVNVLELPYSYTVLNTRVFEFVKAALRGRS